MKHLISIALFIAGLAPAMAQTTCESDPVREIRFPLTERDTTTVFYYFNNEWIPCADVDMVDPDSILGMEVKDDEYGNRALFITLAPETLAELKSKVDESTKDLFINFDPICEFPGGNGKFKEWLEANIRVPEGFKGSERVMVGFTVQPDGSVTDPKFYKASKNEDVNAEALRLVKSLPKFRVKYCTPKKHAIRFTVPIIFKEPGVIFIRG